MKYVPFSAAVWCALWLVVELSGGPIPSAAAIVAPALVLAIPVLIHTLVLDRQRKASGAAPASSPAAPFMIAVIVGALAFFAMAIASSPLLDPHHVIGLGQGRIIDGNYYITGKGHPHPLRVTRAVYEQARRYDDAILASAVGFFACFVAARVTEDRPVTVPPPAPTRNPAPVIPPQRTAPRPDDVLRRRIAERDGQ